MTRFVLAVGTLTVCVAAALAAGPIAVIAVLCASTAIWFGFARSTSTVDRVAHTGGSLWWLVGGVVALVAGFIIPAVDGGELSEAWWSVMAGLVLAGIALLVTGVVLLAARSTDRAAP